MTIRWNDIQNQKLVRASLLADVTAVTPLDFTVFPTEAAKITPTEESTPIWHINGVEHQRLDFSKAIPTIETDIFPARPRPTGFPKAYTNINPVLDAALISSEGLTYSAPIATWIGYYPGMTCNTQIGTVTEFIVGSSATLTVVGISLAGTAYTPNYRLFGQDSSVSATQFAGTITAVNYSQNTITVRATALSRSISPIDATQIWTLTTTGTFVAV